MNSTVYYLPVPRGGACSCTGALKMGKSVSGY